MKGKQVAGKSRGQSIRKPEAKPDVIELHDEFEKASDGGSTGSDSSVEDDQIGNRQWTLKEMNKLLDAIFGAGEDDPPLVPFETFSKNPLRYFQRIESEIFKGTRNLGAIRGRYVRMKNIFTNLLAFENFTGGRGDADLPKLSREEWKQLSMEDIEERLVRTRAAGKECGGVNVRVYERWQRTGWYDRFYKQLNEHPNLERSEGMTFRSGRLSPYNGAGAGDDHSDTESGPDEHTSSLFTPIKKASESPMKKVAPGPTPTGVKSLSTTTQSKSTTTDPDKLPGVPEPKHPGKPSKLNSLGSQAGDFFSATSMYLKSAQDTSKQQLELASHQFEAAEQRHKHKLGLEECQIAIEEKRLAKDLQVEERRSVETRIQVRVESAQALLKDKETPEDLRELAKDVIKRFMEGTL
ncbi:hypothetical protein C8Q79DRAFT_1013700 [Trametes meyenii]|nr:hypothetical protein C8Q79DRAFT_1013700 [Trametes meyenii]